MKSNNVFYLILSLFLILLIVFSSPSYGINILINGLSLHNKNEKINFNIIATLQEGELININYVNLTLFYPNSTQVKCQLFPNKTIINCNFIEVKNISFSGVYEYGYGYGFEDETKYDLGYGYGYSYPGVIDFSLILNTSYLPGGNYQIKAEIFAGYNQTHLFSSTTSSFTILELPWLTSTTQIIPTTTLITTTLTTTTILITTTTHIQTTLPTNTTTPVNTTLTTTFMPTTTIYTTTIQTQPSTIQTSTTQATTTTNICSGRPMTTCIMLSYCEWVGDTRMGYCRQKTIPTTQSSETTTTITTIQTTTTIPNICEGKRFINCILMSHCKWLGDTKTGKCILSEETYIPTTTIITETPITTTTIFVPSFCQQKNFFSCLLSQECRWSGDFRLGYCVEK